ncbi:MAG: AsmA-like C-terminal region-containing protein [Candidatus Acidiferrales bacterium]
MSDSTPEIPTAVPGHAAGLPPVRPRHRSWLRAIVLLFVILWIANAGISLLVEHTSLKSWLTAHLAASFGRPVEVQHYEFSLWTGPALRADFVTVRDDPRFGHEYFLRAESLTVRLRWSSLLRGHFQLGTLSLSHPSLNLVREPGGDWNLEEWLPHPTPAVPPAPAAPGSPAYFPQRRDSTLRFQKILVDDGRINFKRGDEKLPFAFINVAGSLETDGPGRWRLDLAAEPSRSSVVLQQAGMLRLSGHLGGVSSRLRPAVLDLSWSGASISDVLRLVRDNDYGIRGRADLAINARAEVDSWALLGHANLTQLHRWDLNARPDNPSLSLSARAMLDWQDLRFDLSQARIDLPHSHADLTATLDWSNSPQTRMQIAPATFVRADSVEFDLGDALAWIRAFHAGVASDISLNGYGKAEIAFRGWPLRLSHASVNLGDATLSGVPLRVPVRLAPVSAQYDQGILALSPVVLAFGKGDGALRWESSPIRAAATGRAGAALRLSGNVAHVRDLLASAGAFGWSLARGWDLEGPLRCDLRWDASALPWNEAAVGTVDLGGDSGGATLRAPFLNQPVERIRARAEWTPVIHHISLTSAQAFGAQWSGAFDRRNPPDEWKFSLAADTISAVELDRWLNPRWRESFLDRMLPFLSSRAPYYAAPESLRAAGHLTVAEFALAPWTLRRLEGELKIDGRRLSLDGAAAQFYGGSVTGSLRADLLSVPAYRGDFTFTHVDLAALSAASPGLSSAFTGSASGQLSLNAQGAGRADAAASLECQGRAQFENPALRGISLVDSFRARSAQPGVSEFRHASASFACRGGKISVSFLSLADAEGELSASGAVDYARHLDFRLRRLQPGPAARDISGVADSSGTATPDDANAGASFHLTGTLADPRISGVSPPAE